MVYTNRVGDASVKEIINRDWRYLLKGKRSSSEYFPGFTKHLFFFLSEPFFHERVSRCAVKIFTISIDPGARSVSYIISINSIATDIVQESFDSLADAVHCYNQKFTGSDVRSHLVTVWDKGIEEPYPVYEKFNSF